MGLRREHLEGIVRRGQQNEAMLRLVVMDRLVELIEVHLENPEKINTALEIYESIQADEGEYQWVDFKAAILEATSSEVVAPPMVKRRLDLYLRFLFPV